MVCVDIVVLILFSRTQTEAISGVAARPRGQCQSHQESPPGDYGALARSPRFARATCGRTHADSVVTCLDRPECIIWERHCGKATLRRPRRSRSHRLALHQPEADVAR